MHLQASAQPPESRRDFLARSAELLAVSSTLAAARAQDPGTRPARDPSVQLLGPRARVPVGLIIDDSTCLVNLNRFAMPQFDEAWDGRQTVYHRDWKSWPVEIPDAFVRRFAEWAAERGVKGKYSIVPYPACVGRLDRFLPGWSRRELSESLRLVREHLVPNWDIHPEMVTHTRVLDLRTGQPHAEGSLKFMENWDWTTGRSTDELAAYLVYALQILKNVDLPCDGVTTPGGFGSRARPQLAEATLQSVRDVFGSEIPHYFRDLHDSGTQSVAPRVELAADLDTQRSRCVVSMVGCTGDWTGGWDNTEPEGADRFITADLRGGRMVDVIQRGEPALMVCHWTGIYWNGEERGFKILQEVERRLRSRFADQLLWMKLSEVARYWAARELTRIQCTPAYTRLEAPFACTEFTLQIAGSSEVPPRFGRPGETAALREVSHRRDLASGTWHREGNKLTICLNLPQGTSELRT